LNLQLVIIIFYWNDILFPTQYGFRHKRSTNHAIIDLITSCFDNIHSKTFSTLLFLDIKKAFDSVSHKILLKKLKLYGVRGTANLVLQSYLSERKQYVSISNYNSTNKLNKYGVPQRSILGRLLFLTYIHDLPSCLQTVPIFLLMTLPY